VANSSRPLTTNHELDPLRAPPTVWTFCLVSTVVTLLVFFAVTPDLWEGYWRYLSAPVFLAVFLLTYCALTIELALRSSALLSFCNHGSIRCHAGAVEIISFLIVGLTSISFIKTFTIERVIRIREAFPISSSWIEGLLAQNNLQGSLGFVTEPPTESIALVAVSSGRLRALSISTDGNPLIFPHSRSEFYVPRAKPINSRERTDPIKVRTPSWVLAEYSKTHNLFKKYGQPTAILGCDQKRKYLYVFNHRSLEPILVNYFKTWKLDQYRCLSPDKGMGYLLNSVKSRARFR